MVDEREDFVKKGWRQFSILLPDPHESLCQFCHFDTIQKQDRLLITSQTCDVVNSVDKEPYIEVACLRLLDRNPETQYEHGRNSRRIELTIFGAVGQESYYILAHERFPIRHALLKTLNPVSGIEDSNMQDNLRNWIVARYERTAFPDYFINRLRVKIQQIEKSIKKLKLVHSIYIKLSSFSELESGNDYSVELLLIMDSQHFEDPIKFEEYAGYRTELENHIEKCTGIVVESVELTTYDLITVAMLQQYAKWDYSYLSYRDPSANALPK